MKRKRFSKRGETRSALVAAGHKLFSKKPVDAVAIDDIVQEAGVAKGSFYNHFKEKNDILMAVREEVRKNINIQVNEINSGVEDPAVRVARALAVHYRLTFDDPNIVSIILHRDANVGNAIALEVNQGALEDAREGVSSGRFAVPSAESAAHFIVGTGYAGMVSMINDQNVSLVASLARHLILLVLRGLGLETEEAASIAAIAVEQIIRGQGSGNANDQTHNVGSE